MITIYKYELKVIDHQVIEMPMFPKILTAQMQRDKLVLWAEVNPQAPLENKEFFICGTGQNIEHLNFRIYIATVQQGDLVWHIYH